MGFLQNQHPGPNLFMLVSLLMVLKSGTTCAKRVFFSFIIISQVRWPIELKCAQVCHFMHVEIHQLLKASLWQLPIVSTALKTNIRWFIFGMYTLYKSMKSSQFWLVRTALWMWKYLQISQRYDQLFAHFPVEPRVVHLFV